MTILNVRKFVLAGILTVMFSILAAGAAWAHCDAENGPVAEDARKALKTDDFSKVAIWVGEDQNAELKKLFKDALKVYKMGGEAKELAENYFIESSIRLHRAAEGMPYTGVKPAQPLPEDIKLAEKTLKTGNIKPLVEFLNSEIETESKKWFQKAYDSKEAYKGESVAKGREWVDAYVKYVIYVHNLYKTIKAGPPHGVGE